jgi:hypothetical protein
MHSLRVVLVAALAVASACKEQPMASPAQCERLLDRFIDLKLSEDPRAKTMSDVDRAHLRAQIAVDVLADTDVQQVKNQCTTEVTAAEYACAVKAATSKAWNDCIQ